jgi:hypothetical protein
MHIPPVHDTFPVPFDKLAIDFSRANVSCVQKSNHQMHLTISELVIDMVLYKVL